MSEAMYWYDVGAGVWRETRQLWVSDGTAWREAVEAWIWSDGWKRCFVQAGSLDSVSATNPFGDILDIGWTYSAAQPSEWLMSLEYSVDFGASWAYVFENTITADDPTNPVQVDFNGLSGFVSLADTYIRFSMRLGGTTHATNSPTTLFPPYPT